MPAGAVVLMDNTWATPLYFRAFEQGVDLSIQAGTKYIGGHSDVMFGTVSANARHWKRAEAIPCTNSACASDLTTLSRRCADCAPWACASRTSTSRDCRRALARTSGRRSLRVLHPALESDPGHAIWQRDFLGASSLFSVVFKPVPRGGGRRLRRRAQPVRHRRIVGRLREPRDPVRLRFVRTATQWTPGGPAVRLHIGLEDVDDLIDDLERGFTAMRTAR